MEENNTGTYRFNKQTKQVEKVSNNIPKPCIPDWKRKMDPDGETKRCNYNTPEKKLREIYSKA